MVDLTVPLAKPNLHNMFGMSIASSIQKIYRCHKS